MKGFAIALSAVLIAACSACGGGGGGDSAAADKPISQKAVLVESYGDSTTVGCTFTNGGTPATEACPAVGYTLVAQTPTDLLQANLRASLGPSVSVANKGVAGISAADLLYGTNGEKGQTFDASMSTSKAQIVTINLGINDTGLDPVDFSANMSAIIKIAQGHGKTVIIFTPNLITNANAATLVSLRKQILDIATTMHVAVSDDYTAASDQQWPALLSDGVHPTEQGYQLKAQFEANIIAPIVRGMF